MKLIAVEDSVLRGNKDHRGVCGLRVFVRLDIGIIWDDRDEDESKHRYRFILNEVQPGDAGLFMANKCARTNLARGFVQGILRGSLDG